MTTRATTRTAAEIEEILRPENPWDITRFLQRVAIDQAIEEAQRTLDMSLQSAYFAHDADPAEVAVDLLQRADAPMGHKLASLLATKRTLDGCAELPAIKARLEPLYAELASARRNEAEAARVASLAAQDRRETIAQAEAEALAAVRAKFADPEPEPEPSEPAPFRGKNIRPALATA